MSLEEMRGELRERFEKLKNQNKEITLYHGTSSVLKNIIKRKGLTAKRYVEADDGIFLSDWWEIAEKFAEIKVDNTGGDPMICTVDVDPKILTPDLIMYDMPEYSTLADYGCDTGDIELSTECWEQKIKSGEVPFPKDKKDWKTSLDTVHSVIAIAPINRKKVKCRVLG